MGCDTYGKIKGYINHTDIYNYIKNNWCSYAEDHVQKSYPHLPLSEITWKYKLNEHSEANDYWYTISGFINFEYNGEQGSRYQCVFCLYNNIEWEIIKVNET